MSDDDLWEQGRNGDKDALGKLLLQYGLQIVPGIDRKIGRRWRGKIEVDDVMQLAYDAVARNASGIEGGLPQFIAYLRRTAENKLADMKRHEKTEERVFGNFGPPNSEEDALIWIYGKLVANTTSPTGKTARKEIAARVRAAVERLPSDYAAVIKHLYLEGRTVTETAKLIGRNRTYVYELLANAREALRSLLGSESDFFTK